jgi:hypothetical protein
MSALIEGTMITQNIMTFTKLKVQSAHTQSAPMTISGCLLKYKKQCIFPALRGNFSAKYYDEKIATTSFCSVLDRRVFLLGEDFFFSSLTG